MDRDHLVLETRGIYQHPPGTLSRWGVVDVGLKCVHSCKFCYYSYLNGEEDQFAGMRRAGWHSTANLFFLLDSLAEHGFLGFDVTGGEPTAHPGIVDVVARGAKNGTASRIITLGQFLTRRDLLTRLLDAGLTDLLLSVHAVDEEHFASITGGSWDLMLTAMRLLDARGFDYCTNTTVCEQNFRLLPAIATEICRHRVYVSNFIVMNAYYAWSRPDGRAADVQAHYGAVRPYLLEARDILEDAGIAVNVRYAPLCTMRGMERNLVGITGVRHDPHEWMNAICHSADPLAATPATMRAMGMRLPLHDHETHYPLLIPESQTQLAAVRGDKGFPEKCRPCRAISVCDGVDQNYLEQRGDSELDPYTRFRGDLLDRDRLRYHAAHVVKLAPFADARSVVREFLAAS